MTSNESKIRAPRPRISVTQAHIDTAVPRDSGHCMIADAVKAAVPTAEFIAVDLQSIRWTDSAKGIRYVYLTPRVAQVALIDFDCEVRPEPFSFELRGPHILRSGKDKPRSTEAEAIPIAAGFREGDVKTRSVPTRVGGKPPPTGALSNNRRAQGKRREFGLRGLRRGPGAA